MSLRALWNNYTAASSRSAANDMGLPPPGTPVAVGIDSARFLKMCQDGKLLDKKFKRADVDLVFAKFSKGRRLDFGSFQLALVEVSLKKEQNGEDLVEQLLSHTADGPSIKGSTATPTRLHDDKTTYTGVYKAGGPTVIDYEKQSMNTLCDRSKRATVRGIPELAVYGPGGINVLMAPALPCSPFVHLPAGKNGTPGKRNTSSSAGASRLGTWDTDASFEEKAEAEAEDATDDIPTETIQQIKHIYKVYTAASSRSSANDMGLPPPPNPTATGIDSTRFLKLLKDGHVFNNFFKPFNVDLIFSKHSDRRRLNAKGLQASLVDVAARKGVSVTDVVMDLFTYTAEGPSVRGTFAESTRLHDDKSTYTGVYKAGGPTVVDYEKQSMNQLCDRTKRANLRGTPHVMIQGPGDKFVMPSTHNQGLDQSKDHYSRRAKAHGFTGINTGEQVAHVPPTPETVLGKYFNSNTNTSSASRRQSVTPGVARNRKTAEDKNRIYDSNAQHVNIAFLDGQGVSHLTEGADAGLTLADMDITQEQAESVETFYCQYEMHSRSFKEQQVLKADRGMTIDVFFGPGCGIDSSKFTKLCSDSSLFDEFFSRNDVDIVFTKHRGHTITQGKKMDFAGFQNALLEIAYKKGQKLGALIDQVASHTADGPSVTGATVLEANRFYDDKTTYTGTAGEHAVAENLHDAFGVETVKDDNDDEIDMSVTQEQLDGVQMIFSTFAAASKSSKSDSMSLLDSSRFAKLCVDGSLYDKANFTKENVDIVFTKHKSAVIKRRMDFEGFQNALLDIAARKKVPLGDMVDHLMDSAAGGPSNSGTTAESNRFHDDKNTYTGAYKNGGPI